MEKITHFATLQQLDERLGEWWKDRADRFKVASHCAAEPASKARDLSALETMLGDHAEHLGWCSEWTPDLEDFLQQATALATEEILAADPKISATVLRLKLDGKIHHYQRFARAVERLGATVVHRMEALRTLCSTERERWKQEMTGAEKRSLTR